MNILESLVESKKGVRSENFHNYVINIYGNAGVSNGSRRIDHALTFYSDIICMINAIKEFKKGRANGTLCRGISITLKKSEQLN